MAGRGTGAQPCHTSPALLPGVRRDTASISLLALPGTHQAGGGSEKWQSHIPVQVSAFILPSPDTWEQQLSVPECISEWEIQEDMKVDREECLPLPLGTCDFHSPSHSPGSKCSGQKLILSCTPGTDFGTRASRESAFTWEIDFLWGGKKKKKHKGKIWPVCISQISV